MIVAICAQMTATLIAIAMSPAIGPKIGPAIGQKIGLTVASTIATTNLWYALPLVVSVSLVCAATRHELMRPILEHAVRFAAWVVVIMGVFMIVLSIMQRMA